MHQRLLANGTAAAAGQRTNSAANGQGKKRSRPVDNGFLRDSASIRQAQALGAPAAPVLFAAAAQQDRDAARKLSNAASAIMAKRKVQSLHSLTSEALAGQSQTQLQRQSSASSTSSKDAELSAQASSSSAFADMSDPTYIQRVWRARRHAFLERCFPYIQQAAARNEDIVHYGDQLAICLRILTESAVSEDLRQRALSALDPLMTAWHEVAARQLNAAARASPVSPEDVLAAIQSVHCIERCGRSFSKKRQLRDLLGWSRFTPQECFRWDPSAAAPSLADDPAACVNFTNALVYTYFARSIDVDIGCRYTDVLQNLPLFRPYKSVLDLPREQYADQLNLIYHVVMTNSGWGKLQLMRELFAHEWAFLKAQLPILVQMRDINLAAKCMRALRMFRATGDDVAMQQGMRSLLATVVPHRSEATTSLEGEEVINCILAVEGMSDYGTAGFGPTFPDVLPLLLQWAEADVAKLDAYREDVRASHRLHLEHLEHQRQAEGGPEEGKLDTPFGSETTTEQLKELMLGLRTRVSRDFVELGAYLQRSTTPGQIKSILEELATLDVTLQQLATTNIAKLVKKFSNHADPQVAQLAKQITAKWKEVVARFTS